MEAIAELSDDEYPAFFGDFFDLDNYVNNDPEESIETVVVSTMGGAKEVDHETEDERYENEIPETVSNANTNSEVRKFRAVDIDSFLSENENTEKKTNQAMKLFHSFLHYKEESRLAQFIPPDTLNEYIYEFLLSVTK